MTNHQPPQPPETERHLRLLPYQWVAVPLLMLIPLLALLGVFGHSLASVDASDETLRLDVRYPSRTRYQVPGALEITLTNTSGSPTGPVSIHVDTDYIAQFSNVSFTPSVESVRNEGYVIELGDIPAGEARQVTVELRGERYGNHDGTITAYLNERELLHVSISTLVFP